MNIIEPILKLFNMSSAALTNRATFWSTHLYKNEDWKEISKKYVLPGLFVSTVSTFIKYSVIGISIPVLGTIRSPIFSGLKDAIFSNFIIAFASCFVIAKILTVIGNKFKATPELTFNRSFYVVGLTVAISGVISVLQLLPWLGILLVIITGLLIFSLFCKSVVPVLGVPEESSKKFITAFVIISLVVGLLSTFIIAPMFSSQEAASVEDLQLDPEQQELLKSIQKLSQMGR